MIEVRTEGDGKEEKGKRKEGKKIRRKGRRSEKGKR